MDLTDEVCVERWYLWAVTLGAIAGGINAITGTKPLLGKRKRKRRR